MKKMMKKLIAMAAALVMIVTLLPAVGAKAETTSTWPAGKGSIEIVKYDSDKTTQITGGTFNIYQIAVASQVTENGTVSIKYSPVKITGEMLNTLLAADVTNATVLNNQAITIRDYLVNPENSISATRSIQAGEKAEGLDYGLYLIDEAVAPNGYVAGAPILVQLPQMTTEEVEGQDVQTWDKDITVSPKNAKDDLKKVILDGEGNEIKGGTVAAGQTITFKVTGTMPYLSEAECGADNAYITLKDTLTGKMTFEGETVLITVNPGADDEFTVNGTVSQDKKSFIYTVGNDFEEEINNKETLMSLSGKKFEATYNVKVGADFTAIDTNTKNKVELIKNGDGNPTTPEVPVYTFGIEIDKDGANSTPLSGVVFELYSDNNNSLGQIIAGPTATDKDGKLTFNGLDADKDGTVYWLKEVKTAAGYTLLANPVKVTLIAEYDDATQSYTGKLSYKIDDQIEATKDIDRVANVTITNNKGFSLPETGGMGTYLFTIGGIVIMAGAAFALIAMKKRA